MTMDPISVYEDGVQEEPPMATVTVENGFVAVHSVFFSDETDRQVLFTPEEATDFALALESAVTVLRHSTEVEIDRQQVLFDVSSDGMVFLDTHGT